ncbi:family A G protein-coupled receptor-like protein [Ramaria rubella]|nr:family A G protein-coupled receptor-like protein [Ramaria rubella]
MGNQALQKNPPNADLHISTHGSDWLWTAFAIMLLSDLIMILWAYTRPRGARVFHQIPIIVLTTASIAYFAMASDLGATPIPIQFTRGRPSGTTRAIWYVRYIDWTITTPLLLLELLLGTGMSLSDIVIIMFMDLVMIVSGLVGALVHSSYKWGFYAFGLAALFYIWSGLFLQAPKAATIIGTDARGPYIRGAAYLSFIWLSYPIAWAVSEGGNVISPTGEMIFYGVLDVMAKPVFLFAHVYAMRNIAYDRFALSSGKATEATEAGHHHGQDMTRVAPGGGATGTGVGTGAAAGAAGGGAMGTGAAGTRNMVAGATQPGTTGTAHESSGPGTRPGGITGETTSTT